jgi:hypothetical protein
MILTPIQDLKLSRQEVDYLSKRTLFMEKHILSIKDFGEQALEENFDFTPTIP